MRHTHRCGHCIVPPHVLRRLLESENPAVREAALNTLLATEHLRGERSVRSLANIMVAPTNGQRTSYDCQGGVVLANATLIRSESGPAARDATVNRAFEGFGKTRDFYKTVLGRNSIDNKGASLSGYVHRGSKFNNAFWDGREMVFGDGDGVVFTDLTKSIDVIAHELTHGVTENAAGLAYHTQSGALNESVSDVFGSLVKQWSLGQTADKADWLIGAEVWTPAIAGDALRSLKDPGKAYNDPLVGNDPQPDHMSKYVHLPDTDDGDNGGVHINSGIPNKAFYLVATGIGGNAWEAPGHIWYQALLASSENTQFQDFADTTYAKAGQLYGTDSTQQKAVAAAWGEVGLRVGSRVAPIGIEPQVEPEQFKAIVARIDALSKEVAALSKAVKSQKPRR